jgi:hypothetical protein
VGAHSRDPLAPLICPTGKSARRGDFSSVQPHLKKYFGFSESKSVVKLPPSRPTEGRLAIVTDAGRDAVDAGGAKDESADLRTAKACGPDAPTLVSSLRDEAQTTVTRKPDRRGEHDISRKTIA